MSPSSPAPSTHETTHKASSQRSKAPIAASCCTTDRPLPTTLLLDLSAVADAEGLAGEIAVLRASIRQLARDDNMVAHVKVLAELRHQIEALCRVLKTQRSLEGGGDDGQAELNRALEELGDDLGVER